MGLERSPSFNSEIRRLNAIDPRLAQARREQLQSTAQERGPSANEEAIAARATSTRADTYDHARKADKKNIDKILGKLLPLLRKHTVATDVVADNLYNLVRIHQNGDLGSLRRSDDLSALKHNVMSLDNQFKRSNLGRSEVDPGLMERRISAWERNHHDAAGRRVAHFVRTLANNEKRATQFELGGSAGLVVGGGAYLSAGTTRSAWGDNRVTLGLSGTLGITAGATFELQRVRGTVENREGSISNAIQNPSEFYNVVPGMMFWRKRGKNSSGGYADYGSSHPSAERLSLGVSLGSSELERTGVNFPILPLPPTYKFARETLGIRYQENMLAQEALTGRIPVYTAPEAPTWVMEARRKATTLRPATPEFEEDTLSSAMFPKVPATPFPEVWKEDLPTYEAPKHTPKASRGKEKRRILAE